MDKKVYFQPSKGNLVLLAGSEAYEENDMFYHSVVWNSCINVVNIDKKVIL